MDGCGRPGNGMFFRAAQAWTFPGPITVPEEAMYWFRTLNGRQNHVLRFAAGQLPPAKAFWSLTVGDRRNRFVPNPLHRYRIGDRSSLIPNDDGSVDVYLQHESPPGHESNWLPGPAGDFILWLRVYLPAAPYSAPPVEVRNAARI
jgi:hypothetical protein